MGKINTTNYPNRPITDYQDDDMFILQDNGGETYTTNVGDIKDLIGEETDPKLALKVDKNGTDRLMTADEGTKLEGIADGAQVNVLEGVQINGSDLPITNKKVNVDISGKADKVTNATSGHLAGLDSNGNLTDSGVSPTEEVTVEGNPVTFDSPFEQDAKSVVVTVKPIQDLHGYDHPWPAGGGKNKLPLVLADIKALNTSGTWSGNVYSIANGTIEVLVDDADNVLGIKANGTFNADWAIFNFGVFTLPQSDYVLSGITSGSAPTYRLSLATSGTEYNAYDNPVNVSIAEDAPNSQMRFIVRTAGTTIDNVTLYPMLRLLTESDATFAPYSNICPISGTDEVEIEVSGKNLAYNNMQSSVTMAGVTWAKNDDGSITVSGQPTANSYVLQAVKAPVNPSLGKITVSGLADVTNVMAETIALIDSDSNILWSASNVTNNLTVDISPYPTGAYIVISYKRISNEWVCSGTIKPQVEYSTEATPYEPYNPNSHTTTIPLPSTLYDADVDVTNGDADSRYGYIASYNGETLPGAWISDRDVYTGSNSPTIGAEVCYELATPTTLSFDPTDVELLEGMNVVSTNGEKVAVTYGRSLWQDIDDLKTDTEGKLDKSDVADVEGDTASRPYSVNEFMLRSDGFYKVTQPIAQNASITSSNTTKTTIGAVLTALLNA